MTKTVKPERTLKLEVVVNASPAETWKALTEAEGLANWFAPIAKVSRPGLGGEVTVAWTEEMASTARVDAWEPHQRVRWINEEAFMGPGTVLSMEFQLEGSGGKTRVRLVQSGFGASEGWDDFFEGTETGWNYFLYNLRLYLETHRGRRRRMISERFEVTAPRQSAWEHIASAVTGISPASANAIKVGDQVQLELAGVGKRPAVVELAVSERALALRLPSLEDALLFVELESGKESFSVGWYLSIYDERLANELAAPAKQTFQHIHEALPATGTHSSP